MKKRNLIILWLIAPAMLIGVILATQLQPTVICAFQGGDAINEAACVTEVRLRDYDARPKETIQWLFAAHGESASAQVMSSLADWALEEPERFLDLLSRIDDAEFGPSIARLADSIRGNLQDAQFKELFGQSANENERLRRLLDLLR